jgi:hypothetical protein
MWSRADFDTLTTQVPFPVFVDWDTRPSAQKYGHVNSLLAVISSFHAQGAEFRDSTGKLIDVLNIRPVSENLRTNKNGIFL